MHVAVLAFPFGSHALSLLDLVVNLARVAQETRFSFLNTAIKCSIFPRTTLLIALSLQCSGWRAAESCFLWESNRKTRAIHKGNAGEF
uniref:Uncharacterized protein n=1 Tax=Salix viminalis TaxID=40686 RepID=A0A6N2M0R9_SALVM